MSQITIQEKLRYAPPKVRINGKWVKSTSPEYRKYLENVYKNKKEL